MKWQTIESPHGDVRVATAKTPKGVWVSHRGRSFFGQVEQQPLARFRATIKLWLP